MSHIIDLGTYGPQLKKIYDSIVSSDPNVSWAVFNYAANNSQALKPVAEGNGNLEEFVEEFDDGKVQYGFVRIDFDNRPKYVLVGWVGEGVPEQTKGYFNAHYATVAKYFRGYHVQITARSSQDLSPEIINQKVIDASGSKYGGISKSSTVSRAPKYTVAAEGASEDDWGSAPAVKQTEGLNKIQSAYKPTKVDIASIRASAHDKSPASAPTPKQQLDNSTPSSYKPVGKVDIAALRAQSKGSKFADDGPQPLQSSYKPIGKVDIAALRAAASTNKRTLDSTSNAESKEKVEDVKEEEPKPTNVKDRLKNFQKVAAATNEEEEEDYAPKSVKDRMSTFSAGGRLTELPKRAVSNSVSSRYAPQSTGTSRGTAPSIPLYNNLGLGTTEVQNPGFLDHGSEGGKTPAQLWAEKHGKRAVAPPPSEQVSSEPDVQPEQDEVEEEHASVFKAREKFAAVSLEDEETTEVESKSSFSDITSRFASQSAKPLQQSLPVRSVPPPAPEPEEKEEEEEEPEFDVPIPVAVPKEEEAPSFPSRLVEDSEPAEIETLEPVLPSRPVEEEAALPSRANADSASTSLTATVSYDYSKDEDNEISLVEGETVTDIQQVDDDWWLGTNSKGESGLFPANYVVLSSSSDDPPPAVTASAAAAAAAEPEHVDAPTAAVTAGPTATAEFDYTADEEGELTFSEGDLIVDIVFEDSEWWSGIVKGKTVRGLFPANYVQLQS